MESKYVTSLKSVDQYSDTLTLEFEFAHGEDSLCCFVLQ